MTEQTAHQTHIRNTILNAIAEGLWGFAFAFNNFQSVIPVFLAQLGASSQLIGMIPGGFIILLAIPQIASANLFRKTTRLKMWNVLLHFALFPFAFGFVIIFFFLQLTGPLAIALYVVMLAGYSLAIGVLVPIWADFLASITLASKRGRFFGITFTSNAVMGMLGGYILKRIIDGNFFPFPANFGLGWMIMSISLALGSTFFFFMKMIHQPSPQLEEGSLLQRIMKIYRGDRNFRMYIFSRMLGAVYMMPVAFYAIDVQARYDLPLSSVGTFTFFLVLGTAVFNQVFGYLSDVVGRKFSVGGYFIGSILAMLTARFLDTSWSGYLIFIFMGMTTGAMQSSFMVFVYEFAGEKGDRKLYYAALDTAVAPALLLYISMGGTIVERFGYETLYSISLAIAISAALFFWLKVKAPPSQN